MRLFKLTFFMLILGAIFVVAPATTFAEEEAATAECAEAAASLGAVALAAGFLLVPSSIYALRRRLQK
jgi:hypothetical protein